MSRYITAVDMARAAGVDPKKFRGALRQSTFAWHRHLMPWTVVEGSAQHKDMLVVLSSIVPGIRASGKIPIKTARGPREHSDEHYIIDICDRLLGTSASRGHRFDFLLGDPCRGGLRRALPVDAYYANQRLVIEYCERQHTERTPFFDKKLTVSGVTRGEQRKLYDQRRRDILPNRGISLVEFHFSDFSHTAAKRLRREEADIDVVRRRLSAAGFL